jgi:hypothetical protein
MVYLTGSGGRISRANASPTAMLVLTLSSNSAASGERRAYSETGGARANDCTIHHGLARHDHQ